MNARNERVKNVSFLVLIRSKLSPAQLFHAAFQTSNEEDKDRALTTVSPVPTKALVIDFKETEKFFEIDVDFPGMTKEEISISTNGNILTVSGERKFSKEKEDDGKYHTIERSD